MWHYHLFGRTLASELAFPELPAASAPSDGGWWSLTATAAPPPDLSLPRLGAEPVMDGVTAVLSGGPARYRLAYDDTGIFEITDRGRRIVWHRPGGAAPDPGHVRADVLGRVMAVALHAAGIPALHGSAVVLHDAGVAFVAPKGYGKSTTAAALVRAGAALLSDDIVAVLPGRRPEVVTGVPAVHLWRDAAAQIRGAPVPGDDALKARIDWGGAERSWNTPAPLAAVYLLAPARPEADAVLHRERLPPVTAALTLVGQAKIGALLGPANAGALLEACAALSAQVPVYRLVIPRNLARIDDLVRRFAEWHDAPLTVGTRE
jgi:hypothetical protein